MLLLKDLTVKSNYKLQVSNELVLARLTHVRFQEGLTKLLKQTNTQGTLIVANKLGRNIEVNFDTESLIIDSQEYKLRKYVVVNSIAYEGASEASSSLVPAKDVIVAFAHMVRSITKGYELDNLVKLLQSKVLADVLEQKVSEGQEAYGRDNGSAQAIIESHKISAIGIVSTGSKNAVSSKGKKLTFCKADFTGNEIETIAQFFLELKEPIFCDKNNKKYVVFGDGCRAAGVDLVDGKLVTINPVDLKKAAKILNRMASHFYLSAPKAILIEGNTGTERTVSNLHFALSGGNTVQHKGLKVPVFVSLGAFGLANGVAETNQAKNVRFGFEVPKTLTNSINIARFDEELRANPDKLVEQVRDFINSQAEIAAYSALEFNGVPILVNKKHFAITLTKLGKGSVRLSGYNSFSNKPRTLEIEVKGYAAMLKASPKLRGLTKKMTAFQTNTVIRKDGTELDWTMLINREAIKGSSALVDIFANALSSTSGEAHPNYKVVWNAGVLTVDGTVWTQENLIEWFKDECETYTIDRVVDATVASELESLKGFEAIASENLGANQVIIRETVLGFFGTSTMDIEVSTADENHGVSYLGVNEQQILSFAGKGVSDKLHRLSANNLANADLLAYQGDLPVINATDVAAINNLFVESKSFGTKTYMNSLMSKFKHGVRIELNAKGRIWSTNLRFDIFTHFGHWDKAGYPVQNHVVSTDKDTEVSTLSLMDDAFDFIKSLRSGADVETLCDWFAHMNLVEAWISNLKSAKRAANLVKAGVAFHQKVIGDLTIGYHRGLPIVRLGKDNPLLKDNAVNNDYSGVQAKLRSGSMVFLSRCPLPLFTACVVEVVDNLDSTMIAVNPLTWIKSNLGDFDGDLGYLVPAANYGFNKFSDAVEFNEKFSALSHHWNVFNQQITPPMQDGVGTSPVLDALAVKDSVVGADKEADALLSEWTQLSNSISVDKFVELAKSVNNHYSVHVGELYNYATAYTQSIGDRAFNGSIISEKEIRSLILAWFYYEQFGLGGYSLNNSSRVADIKEAIDEQGKPQVSSKSLEVWGVVINLDNNSDANRSTALDTPTFIPNAGVITAAACAIRGREIQNGTRMGGSDIPAATIQAIRILSRKTLSKNEVNVFKALEGKELKSRFANQIQTIGKLRLLNQ